MLGRVVSNFRVVAPLGAGGMGEVWKAEQLTLGNRPVALKILSPKLVDVGRAIERIRREGALAARVKHPAIAEIYDAGEADGVHFVAMEFIDGESLAARLARGPLEPDAAVRLVRAIAGALAHAHGLGVLHRDVSAGNIMVETTGRAVLVDFGLALDVERSRLTSSGVIVGNPQYLSPEVLQGHAPDHRSDLYSLGVVFYEALTATHPFPGVRSESAIQGALFGELEAPSRRRPGLPQALDALVLRAMAREPVSRYQSAEELIRALEDLERSVATTETIHRPGTPVVEMRSLAVLPFAAAGTGDELHALALGFAEAVSASLARHASLSLVPPSATADMGPGGAARAVRELGVRHVLSGTLQGAGGRLRVTWSLLGAEGLRQLRADLVEGTAEELFAIQDRIARDVAAALGAGPAPIPPPASGMDPIAHERYLQALGYLQRFDNEAALDGAIAILEKLTRDPGAPAEVWATLGRAYRQKYGHEPDRVWLERAAQAGQRAVSLDPGSAEALAVLAHVHKMLGRAEEAERMFRRGLERHPQHLPLLLGLVELLRSEGRLDEAETECRRAIAVRPDAWSGHNTLGAILNQRGRWADAIQCWQEVVRLTPDNPRGHYNMGAAYFEMGDLDRASAAYGLALSLHPSAAAHTGLGTVRFYQGELEKARESFQRAVGLRPSDPLMWGNLGDACRWLPNREDEAASAFSRAIAIGRERLAMNPRDSVLLGQLAGWLGKNGQLDQARETIRRALDLDPQSAANEAQAAWVMERSGERSKALEHVARAVAYGYSWFEMDRDPDLQSLRESSGYAALREQNRPGTALGAGSPEWGGRPGR